MNDFMPYHILVLIVGIMSLILAISFTLIDFKKQGGLKNE